jgi:capsid assembly protease
MTVQALDLILGEPWAITPEGMSQVLSIAQRVNDAPETVVSRLGRPLENARRVRVQDGVAVIPVTGPIFRRANLFTEISGATSVEILALDIRTALEDSAVRALLLEFDTPGGQAAGISELARLIHGAEKPVYAHTDGLAASAGYWLFAAARAATVSSTGLLGSIGVVISYRPEKDAPIKVISSQSPLKQATPETEAGKSELQRLVDDMAAVFVADVAVFRGVPEERVLAQFGRGGMLVGAKAVAAGMADRVTTADTILASQTLNSGLAFTADTGGFPMSLSEALAQALGISANASDADAVTAVNQLKANRKPSDTELAKARQEGAQAEQARIFGIIEHAEAEGRMPVAIKVAKAGGLSVEDAAAVLAAVPKASAASSDPLANAMARLGNPPVSNDDSDDSEESAEAMAKRIASM